MADATRILRHRVNGVWVDFLGTSFNPVNPPVAQFTSSVSALTVQFDASNSSGGDANITNYYWNFGDGVVQNGGLFGKTDIGQTASHTYTAGGTYTVTLTVTTDDGDQDSQTSILGVTAGASTPAPTVTFTPTVNGAVVSATAQTTGAINSYLWDFGDQAQATTQSVSHTYAASGTYQISCTVVATDQQSAIAVKSVTATVAVVKPVASFTDSISSDGKTVAFTSTSSGGSNGITTWNWAFGDGATGSGYQTTHVYTQTTAAQNLTATLTVSDAAGNTSTASRTVTIVASTTTPVASSGNGDNGVNQTGTASKQQTTGGTLYQNLSGSTVQAKVTAGGTTGVSFAAGTFEFGNFSGSGTSGQGLTFVSGTKAILGAGSASSILRMPANLATGHSNATSGTTALFYTYLSSPPDGFIIDGVNFQGTPQNGLLYHGMQIEAPGNSTISNTTFSGMPGNSGSPPGETFGLSIHQQAVGKTFLIKNCTFDGKQVSTGTNVGAAISGTNTTRGVVTFQDCLFQNAGYSAGLALWEIATGGTVNLIRPVFKNNHRNLGNEAQGGTINIYDPVFAQPTASGEDDIRITWTNLYNEGVINIYFTTAADWTKCMAGRTSSKLISQTGSRNSTEYEPSQTPYTGSKTIPSCCHVFVAGVEQTLANYWTVPNN